MGITFATFSCSGKIPDRKNSFIRTESSIEICESSTLSNLTGMLVGPEDLSFFED